MSVVAATAGDAMDFIPYVKEMGWGGAVVFFGLYLREAYKRDGVTKQFIDLLPQVVLAMNGISTSMTTLTQQVRDGARRDAPRD